MNENFIIEKFEPLYFTIDSIGPFRGQPYEIDFTDSENNPCNLFLLLSTNGRGKTTVLQTLTRLMDFVFKEDPKAFGHEDVDTGKGRVQWDVRLKVDWRGAKSAVMLSFLAGDINRDRPVIKEWSDAHLEKFGIEKWHRIGFRKHTFGGRWQAIGRSDEFVSDFIGLIQAECSLSASPGGFEEPTLSLPRVLFFSAYRDIDRVIFADRSIVRPDHWGFSPVYEIVSQGTQWNQSLDNLLVWLKWLDDGRFEKARDTINNNIFSDGIKFLEDVRKDPPEAIINNGGEKHRLDQLSGGEKSLVQLFLRIGAHMTQNTVILIDELDVHLHPNWQHHLLNLFKVFLREHPGTTIIASTHSREILRAFPLDIPEPGVRKGGDIIKEGIA